MITVKAVHNKNLLDSVVNAAGTIEVLFESALKTGQSITDIPLPGSEILVVEPIIKIIELTRELPKPRPIIKTAALAKQTLQDLTIQTTGGMENIFELALLNGLSITAAPTPGKKYNALSVAQNDIVNYYKAKGIKPATGIVKSQAQTTYAVWEYVVDNYWI